MHRNTIWVAFLIIVVGVSIWFVVRAGYDLIHYYQLNTQVPVSVEKWEIKELGANKYVVMAIFSYQYEEKNYQSSGQVGERYPNPWAAKRALSRLEKQSMNVWISSKMPEKGLLNKKFPYKGIASAAILLGLVAYFICIGLYVGIKNEQ